jgi:hypothetical protein
MPGMYCNFIEKFFLTFSTYTLFITHINNNTGAPPRGRFLIYDRIGRYGSGISAFTDKCTTILLQTKKKGQRTLETKWLGEMTGWDVDCYEREDDPKTLEVSLKSFKREIEFINFDSKLNLLIILFSHFHNHSKTTQYSIHSHFISEIFL